MEWLRSTAPWIAGGILVLFISSILIGAFMTLSAGH